MRAAPTLFTAAVLTASAAGVRAESQCRAFDKGEEVAILADEEIQEASGLSASWLNPDLFWIHNDSGDAARLFAVDQAGQTVSVVQLDAATARDWEDMAVGPCGADDPDPCIYVADIGDNNAERPTVSLVRFPEPRLGDPPQASVTVDAFDRIEFTYADGPRDAEALLVHPTDARIFIVDKTPGDPSNMWLVDWEDGTTATKVAATSTGEDFIFGNRVTGGDFAPDGSEFSIKTYGIVYTYCGADPVQAFEEDPSSVIPLNLKQSEALTYARDGSSIWITTEVVANIPAPLVRLDAETPAPAEPEPGADTSPTTDAEMPSDASLDDAATDSDNDAAPEVPAVSGSSCACSENRKADSPSGAGFVLVLILGLPILGRLRTRTPPG